MINMNITSGNPLEQGEDRELSGRTAVFMTLAHPVTHLMAPTTFARRFRSAGRDAVMIAADVAQDDLSRFVDGLRAMSNLVGFCVTIPHKQAIVPLLDQLTPAAVEAGAVNVVRRDADGTLVGTQVDGEGFVRGMLDSGHAISGRSVYLAGAGGAATGIAFALARSGVSRLCIANRTVEKAAALAERVRAAVPECDISSGGDPSGFDIVINGTSAGLSGANTLPFDVGKADDGAIVAEVVMTPRETPLIRAALKRGLRVQFGEDMLTGQLVLMEDFWRLNTKLQAGSK